MMDEPDNDTVIKCFVKNCQKELKKEQAIKIGEHYFCGICGVAYYRSNLNL